MADCGDESSHSIIELKFTAAFTASPQSSSVMLKSILLLNQILNFKVLVHGIYLGSTTVSCSVWDVK